MATVSSGERTSVGGPGPFEPWRVFSGQERRQMLHDDVEAGVTISLILTGVIFAGLVLMLIGVALSL